MEWDDLTTAASVSTQAKQYITDSQIEDFCGKGYCVLESVLTDTQLEGLRQECGRFMADQDRKMDELGVDTMGITHRGKRYFFSRMCNRSRIITDFLFCDLMAEVTQALLGDNVHFFWDQYVVKCAEVGMKFGWHQDSGYVGHPHKPYITCYCPLDDYSEENGTVYLLPYDRAGTRDLVKHTVQKGTNDLVGYFGDDPGDAMIAPAGSLIVFSSFAFHRSGANTTNNMRRGFLAAYSCETVLTEDGKQPFGCDAPFIQNGKRVRHGAPGDEAWQLISKT